MSWIKKSDDSFKATNKLIKDSLYNTSIHCSYYSCIQLALFIINESFGITLDEIDYETSSKGSHNWIINKLSVKLSDIKDRRSARTFSGNLNELKRLRVIADYKQDYISEETAIEVRQSSFEINKFLKETFF